MCLHGVLDRFKCVCVVCWTGVFVWCVGHVEVCLLMCGVLDTFKCVC